MGQSPKSAPEISFDPSVVRWFLQNSDSGYVGVRDGRLVFVSPSWEKMTGWSRDQVIGRTLREFAHPDELNLEWEIVREVQKTGRAESEQRVRAASGEWMHVRSKISKTPDGLLLIVAQDITELRREAEERRAAERANSLLREAVGLMTWRFNPITHSYSLDQDAGKLWAGVPPDGRTVTADQMIAALHPDDFPLMEEAMRDAVRTGATHTIDYRHHVAETGAWIRFRGNWRGGRKLDNNLWEVIGITQDVTEMANTRDAALAAAEAKAQFLANMSHEIRTPMNGVLGVLHLLGSEPLSPDGRRLVEEALACGRMLSELLNDIIDFSRIEAGRLDLAREPVDPATLLASVAGLVRPDAERRGLALMVEVEPGLGWFCMDPVRVRQMLFNLIGNAVKFTPRGRVTARLSRPSEGRLRFEIEDTGIGIAPEAQGGLFQRFTQADGSTTRQFGGSGLGLAITRRLAELMAGEVGFSSRLGEGSLFWFEIEAPPAAPPDAATPSQAEDLLGGLRVLVVEDNATNRMIATRMLEQLGATVVTAENGREGLDVATRETFDLIFMDIQMPVMDGVAATRGIRALPEPAGRTPILAMTANAMAHQTGEYLAAGMTGVVSKPLSPAELVSAIQAAADGAD